MQTTEVFVEQVLIGLLVLLSPALIFFDEINSYIENNNSALNIGEGAAIIVVAYLTGIVYDRFADTILEDIEQRNRLTMVKGNQELDFDTYFEEDYRMGVLQNEHASTYAGYLRSRIRLSRSMATLIPALSVSFLLMKTRSELDPWWWNAAAIALPATYALTFLLQLIRTWVDSNRRKEEKKKEEEGIKEAEKIDRMEQGMVKPLLLLIRILMELNINKHSKGTARRSILWRRITKLQQKVRDFRHKIIIPSHKVPKTFDIKRRKEYFAKSHLFSIWFEPVSLALIILLAVEVILIVMPRQSFAGKVAFPSPTVEVGKFYQQLTNFWGKASQPYPLWHIPILSIALTLLIGWTWWRISQTYMAFLRSYYEFMQKNKPAP